MFEPVPGKSLSSADFQTWLRSSFRALLVESAREVAAMVAAITPHSFRAGLASDLEHENVTKRRIKRAGRWDSDKAVEKYIRPRLAQRLRRLQYRPVRCDRHGAAIRTRAANAVGSNAENSSEGYDSSGGDAQFDSGDGDDASLH